MKFNFMKKNQVVVAVIGLMLITAGYLNFTNNEQSNQLIETQVLTDTIDMAEIGDAKLVSSQPANDSNILDVESNVIDTNKTQENNIVENEIDKNVDESNKENTTQTNANITTDEYFTKSRLERDTMYSQMLESYQKILDKTTISESQRTTAQKEISKINEQKNAIMITENLIKNKGFEDLIIFINDNSINVIIKVKELKADQIAQIQNIITRELKADITDIHISNKS